MQVIILLILIAVIISGAIYKRKLFERNRQRRRDYYRNVYLKSDAWQRKRYVVLKRDNWRCVYCGGRATQVHHKRYAKYNIGKEPIEWLVSVCDSCHNAQHC
jgi:5-methylcytosine-specific restriction endonuclease McrA